MEDARPAQSLRSLQFDPRLKECMVRCGADPDSESVTGPAGEREVAVVVRLHKPDEPVPGLRVISRMGHIQTGRLRIRDIVPVRCHRNVASLKATSLFGMERTSSIENIGIQHRFGRPDRYTGKGAIVGVIDWGVDFAHKAFLDAEGNTRLRCIWDQRGPGKPDSPQPYGYGRILSRQQINGALATRDPYQTLGYDPATIDSARLGTHGTHVLSIAAGRAWRQDVPSGVAPDAELIFVHLRGDDTRPEDTLGDSVRVLEAVDFIFREAGDKPVVINMSLGRTGDAKDGSSPVEQALDAMVTERPGRAICMSTGNYFTSRLHASATVHHDREAILRWQIPRGARRSAAELEIWYDGQQSLNLTLIDPNGRPVLTLPPGATRVIREQGAGTGRLLISGYHRLNDPNNHDNQINLFIQPGSISGEWRLKLTTTEPDPVYLHAWIERERAREQSRFHPGDTDPNLTIGTICCGRKTLATAAYRPGNGRPGRIAPFSSAGPTRDNRMVPLITAPGDGICAAKSSTIDPLGFRSMHGYTRKSGTSMAAPHLAGTVALMFEAARRPLPIEEIRRALITTARRPDEIVPQLRYGAGLLDAASAIALVESEAREQREPAGHRAPRRFAPKEENVMHNEEFEQPASLPSLAGGGFGPEDLAEQGFTMQHAESPDLPLAEDRPTLSQRAEISFTNLHTVNGSDGRPHVYVVTIGDPQRQRATFRLRIRNRNSVYNMNNAQLKLRFSTMRANRVWHTVPLAGQAQGRDYLVVNTESIPDETSLNKSIAIGAARLQQAYDADYPLARLEVEFHWREGVSDSYYYNRNSVTFYLVNPVEFLFRTGTRLGELVTNRPQNRSYWLPIWEKTFSAGDQSPVSVQSTITTSVASSSSFGINYSYRSSETRGTSSTVSTNVEQSSGGSLSFGIDDIVELGVSSERTMSVGTSTTVSRSFTREVATSLSRNQTFTRALNTSKQVTMALDPAPAGQRRVLIAYPVFQRWQVDLVRFTGTNSDGMATRRSTVRRFPTLIFSHWGVFSDVRPGSSDEEIWQEDTGPALEDWAPDDDWPAPEGHDDQAQTFEALEYAPEPEEDSFEEFWPDSEQWSEAGANRKLRADEVKYLVLEGGGGKGLIYLGAIKALEAVRTRAGHPIYHVQNGRLRNIRGVAGASAGAISALGLSMGMTSAELERIADPRYKDFEEFFDLPASPRKLPAIGRNCTTATGASVLDQYLFAPVQAGLQQGLAAVIPNWAESRLNPATIARDLTTSLKSGLYRRSVQGLNQGDGLGTKLLSPAMIYYAQNLWQDLGLFSGCAARQFLDQLIQQRGGSANMTFADHLRRFGVKLVLTGSNLETGRTMMFSADYTPQMPVADAVRLSMGLPGLFKPVRISRSQAAAITRGARHRPRVSNAYEGLYVDGGLWNNLPMPVFAADEGSTPGTLGLALGNSAGQRQRISDLGDYLGAIIGQYSSDDALANKYPSYRQQVIALNTGNIGTADFSPNRAELSRLQAEAQRQVTAYFR